MVMGEETLETQVAVIGGGPGGYAAAFRAASLDLDVTLISAEERLGGVCLLRGCIPSKALLQATKLIHDTRQAKDWGLTFDDPRTNLDKMRAWKNGIVDRLVNGLHNLTDMHNIELIRGRAVFEASNEVRVVGGDIARVKFEHAILATGSLPIRLPGTEFSKDSRIMDSAAALELPEIPDTLLVVGGGYIGLELGSVYAILGSQVTMVEMTDELLPGTDRDLVKPLARRVEGLFKAIHLNTKVTNLKEDENGVSVTLEGETDEPSQRFDRVLVAIGRRPNSQDIGLENTDVEVDDQGFVIVDEQRRTADPHIFAIGDLVGGSLLAHKAMHEGKIAAEVVAGEPAEFDVRCIPAVVYTDPEIAWCGLTEDDAREQGRSVKVGRFPWAASGRALTEGTGDGLTKLVFDADTERILGIGIVGRDAEDMIAEGALAVEMGALAQDLALTIHPHPTLSETESEAADAFLGMATHIFSKSKR
jgi:dihydrolipoamide dehydrogenase